MIKRHDIGDIDHYIARYTDRFPSYVWRAPDSCYDTKGDKSKHISSKFNKKLFLSKAERDYLLSAGNLQMSDSYSRVIKSRLQKKIALFASKELPLLIEKGFIQLTMFDARSVTEIRNVTGNCNNVKGESNHDDNDVDNKNGAGSGNFVLFHRISNPRVLSDMGLAIPRPTRLGDPRSSSKLPNENIISFANPSPTGDVASTLL
jgi:hypothetical protein